MTGTGLHIHEDKSPIENGYCSEMEGIGGHSFSSPAPECIFRMVIKIRMQDTR
jgi:hypothetical protein